MWTVRVVPTPRGGALVQVTLVITFAQCGQESASSSTSKSCSGVIDEVDAVGVTEAGVVDEVDVDELAGMHVGHAVRLEHVLVGTV